MTSDGCHALELTLTEQDYVAFSEYTWTASRFNRHRYIRRRIVNFLAPPLGVATVAIFHGGPFYAYYVKALVAAGLGASMIWGLATWALHVALIRSSTKRVLRNGTFASYFRPSRMEVSEDGISCISALGTQSIKWPAILDIVATANAVYAYISSQQALIVPRRVFRDETAFEAFLQMLRQHRQKFGAAAA